MLFNIIEKVSKMNVGPSKYKTHVLNVAICCL